MARATREVFFAVDDSADAVPFHLFCLVDDVNLRGMVKALERVAESFMPSRTGLQLANAGVARRGELLGREPVEVVGVFVERVGRHATHLPASHG
ncbi:hypothetical protein J7E25_10795 [Agromyces sp. ISL-38]|uniref:hypothetical protein n=1 Tax=Agromyces sp. ISL-38 TaxID=2819107 RepID=UPI001BE4FD83|nr:hypothetical protein [Agromyces sp. ISL-38]MBT2499586.1 hypothetical protein [Agromyces sp. ISL-38]